MNPETGRGDKTHCAYVAFSRPPSSFLAGDAVCARDFGPRRPEHPLPASEAGSDEVGEVAIRGTFLCPAGMVLEAGYLIGLECR